MKVSSVTQQFETLVMSVQVNYISQVCSISFRTTCCSCICKRATTEYRHEMVCIVTHCCIFGHLEFLIRDTAHYHPSSEAAAALMMDHCG